METSLDTQRSNTSLLSITYTEWKEQQKLWLPVYDFDKQLQPVKKLKRKSKPYVWKNQHDQMIEDGARYSARKSKQRKDKKREKPYIGHCHNRGKRLVKLNTQLREPSNNIVRKW